HRTSCWMLACRSFFLGLGGGGEEHSKYFIVEGKPMAQLRERSGDALENNIHVKAGSRLLVRDAGKILLVHLLDRFDFSAGCSDFGGNLIDGIFDTFFFRRVV